MTASPPDPETRRALLAALAFQLEAGVDETIGETPVDRFAAVKSTKTTAATSASRPSADAPSPPDARRSERPPAPATAASAPEAATAASAPEAATAAAAAAQDLAALAAAAEVFEAGPAGALKSGATRFVFADGRPGARLMIIGEAPGQEEDRRGKPFVGRAGQLLDTMLAAIGLSRTAEDPDAGVYIANILPWRPPGNRTPTEDEAAIFLPFIERHIALAAPERLLLLGNTPLRALTGQTTGITRARGTWRVHPPTGVPLLASFHPAYLLRTPAKKREAWADLLEIADALDLPPLPALPEG